MFRLPRTITEWVALVLILIVLLSLLIPGFPTNVDDSLPRR